MQKMQILRNLKAIDCCKIPLNGNFIYFPTDHAKCKKVGSVRNDSVFAIVCK